MKQKRSFTDTMQNTIGPFANAIGNLRPLMAVRDGLAQIIPLIIVGSIFILLQNFPIPGYEAFMSGIFGATFTTKLGYAVNGTFSLIGMVSAYTIAHAYAVAYKQDGQNAGLISLASFVVLIPLTTKEGGIPLNLLGSQGLFVAIIVSLISAEIYHLMIKHNVYIKMPSTVPPNVALSFVALLPALAAVSLFTVIRWLIEFAGWGSAFNIIQMLVGKPLGTLGTGYVGGLVCVMVIQFFWIFGIHGANIVGSVMMPIWLSAADQNRLAFQAGAPRPNIIAQPFFDNLLWLGGSGVLISLAILVTFFSKSQQFKELGKIGFVPTIFSVNEPFIFGIPVVLNPTILIPYLIVPIVDYNILYWATYFNIIPRVTGVILPWTTPPLINGFLATGSWVTVLLQAGIIVLSMAIYYPFFKILDNQHLKEEAALSDQAGAVADA